MKPARPVQTGTHRHQLSGSPSTTVGEAGSDLAWEAEEYSMVSTDLVEIESMRDERRDAALGTDRAMTVLATLRHPSSLVWSGVVVSRDEFAWWCPGPRPVPPGAEGVGAVGYRVISACVPTPPFPALALAGESRRLLRRHGDTVDGSTEAHKLIDTEPSPVRLDATPRRTRCLIPSDVTALNPVATLPPARCASEHRKTKRNPVNNIMTLTCW